jgi:hypothetical protein
LEEWAVYAQIASAVATVILAGAVFFQIKTARRQATATRETVDEMRESRKMQERPQVIVDADYSHHTLVYLVIRNLGRGAAKDITFHFSDTMPSSINSQVNEQPYFKRGIDFLAPGAEIRTIWDTGFGLMPLLREKGLEQGITITSKYKSLSDDEPHENSWRINPLLMEWQLQRTENDLTDLVKVIEAIAKDLHKVVDSSHRELRTSTDIERQKRRKPAGQQESTSRPQEERSWWRRVFGG